MGMCGFYAMRTTLALEGRHKIIMNYELRIMN